jgi:hypothetical protein
MSKIILQTEIDTMNQILTTIGSLIISANS